MKHPIPDRELHIEQHIAALRSPDSEVRWRAAVVLGWLRGTSALASLIAALHDPEWAVRHSAVWALGQIGDARALDPLLGILHDPRDEDEQVRYVAALALLRLGAQPQLQAALASHHEAVRRAAGAALVAGRYLQTYSL